MTSSLYERRTFAYHKQIFLFTALFLNFTAKTYPKKKYFLQNAFSNFFFFTYFFFYFLQNEMPALKADTFLNLINNILLMF